MYVFLSISIAVVVIFISLLRSRYIKKKIYQKIDDYAKNELKKVDIMIDGDRPWDIKVNNKKLIQRIIKQVVGIDRTGTNNILIIYIF